MCLLYCLTFYIHTYFSLQLDHSVEVRQQGLYCFPVSFSFVYELVCTLYEFGPQRNSISILLEGLKTTYNNKHTLLFLILNITVPANF